MITCQYCGAKHNLKKGKKAPITGIIRTKDVCNKCFKIVKEDNQRRMENRISIPANF